MNAAAVLMIVAAATLQSDPFVKLGRARADFGDKPNSGLWKYAPTSQFGGTWIYFPVGRSDRRYYLTSVPAGEIRLCRESKKGKAISLDWMIRFEEGRSPLGVSNPGTLYRVIYLGYGPVGPVPKTVIADLQAKDALACYRLTGGPTAPFAYVMYPSGRESEEYFDWSLEDSDYPRLPRTLRPYPITREERALMQSRIGPKKPGS